MDDTPGLGWLPHMPHPITGCWYIDSHWDHQIGERSPTGDLLYDAKTYGQKLGQPWAARELAGRMAGAASSFRSSGPFRFDRVDVVVSVPANPAKIPYNLPDVLAESVASALGKPFRRGGVVKTRPTGEAKTRHSISSDAYGTSLVLNDETVLIVDDVVHSGRTLAAVGSALRAAGAARIGGYVATFAKKGLTL